jgi:hypothetical protein
MNTYALTWGIAGLARAGVITRPFKWPEAVWAVAGALLLVLLGPMPLDSATLPVSAREQPVGQTIGQTVDFAHGSPPRAADRLGPRPLFPPAAERCAFT